MRKNIFFLFAVFLSILFTLLRSLPILSDEIPIIVISPSKTPQSLSSTGSDVTSINNQTIADSNQSFLGDIIEDQIVGSNFSKQGGAGTNSLIQIRGLPKRYTNIYLDGVKLSDPSTPDNSYYLNNFTVGSLRSLEVLKGNQSSIYGSGAIGGVVNLYSRDGTEKNNKTIQLNTGSNDTKNLILTYGNEREKYNYSLTLEKYITNGFSSMSDNEENDSYKNNNFHSSFGIELNKNTRIETNLKIQNSLSNYDEVIKGRDDKNNTRDSNYISNIKIINKKKKI